MSQFWLGVVWFLATSVLCSAYTTSTPTAMGNETMISNDTSKDLLVDAYQNLRDILSKKLDDSYPVPLKFYSNFNVIRAAFEPLQIITLDEVLQSISISSAITLIWRDPSISWAPQDFEGIQAIKLASSLIWLPNIIIPETSVEDGLLKIPELVDVSYQGNVSVLIPSITTTLCNLDLTYFPFDSQNCTLAMIETEYYNMTSTKVSLGEMSKYFGTNAAWRLVSHDCYPHLSWDTEPPVTYVSCHVEIRRRSAFYVVNLIGPMGMTSLMTLLAFCVPAEGGEKVSFIVSMFMSTSVFYNYIINITPRSMEHLPRVNILLVAIAVQIIFATAAIVFVLTRFRKTKMLQKQKDRRPLLELDTPNDYIGQKESSTAENARKPSYQPNKVSRQETSWKETPLEDSLKKQLGRSTSDEADAKAGSDPRGPKVDRSPRSLTADQLDMLFFCVMSVLTILLYVCIFAV